VRERDRNRGEERKKTRERGREKETWREGERERESERARGREGERERESERSPLADLQAVNETLPPVVFVGAKAALIVASGLETITLPKVNVCKTLY